MRYQLWKVAAILVSGCIVGCTSPSDSKACPDELSSEDVVRIAELFVVDNGYTTKPARRDKLIHEPIEFGSEDEILARRAGRLREGAFGFSRYPDGWGVYFPYADKDAFRGKRTGRLVVMGLCGEEPTMQHTEVPLDTAEVVINGSEALKSNSPLL